jgi:hypothetical protein
VRHPRSFFNISVVLTVHPRGASMARLQIFLVESTCFLYLVAAGLFARSV